MIKQSKAADASLKQEISLLFAHRRFLVRLLALASAWLGVVSLLAASPPAPEAGPAASYQRHGLDPRTPLESRLAATPASVLALFRELGGPAPTAHSLTAGERSQLDSAINCLPPVHRRVLKERLRVLSFLDGMPNTALTSTVNPDESFRLFDITFNARILHQNVSEWLTQKERTCFDTKGSPLGVEVDAGKKVDALVYVLIHEATHIVDMSERITPPVAVQGKSVTAAGHSASAFTEGIWNDLSLPVAAFRDPLREHVRFYVTCPALPIDRAPDVYAYLSRTPFASLYGGRNWLDDLAEYVSVYHLTEVLKQPYRLVIRRGNQEIFAYEPMKSDLVRRRIGQMKRFYVGG